MEKKMQFLYKTHIRYLLQCLRILPYSTVSLDTSRMTVLFFAISGLDILNALDYIEEKEKNTIIEWIYSLQVLSKENGKYQHGGFRGGSVLWNSAGTCFIDTHFDNSHIAMTYAALATLIILGDDLNRIDKEAILSELSSLQCHDGSFYATSGGSENDMRFIYCAAAICHFLQCFKTFNKEAAVNYILESLSFEGAFGQGPYLEAHGGSTYCALASLKLMCCQDFLTESQKENLVHWLISRQQNLGGLQGRPNKPSDTCYTFWIGASLEMLNGSSYLNCDQIKQFVLATQDPITGGLAKNSDCFPDGLHTYLGISGLSLIGFEGLLPVDAVLNISKRAEQHLQRIHSTWL